MRFPDKRGGFQPASFPFQGSSPAARWAEQRGSAPLCRWAAARATCCQAQSPRSRRAWCPGCAEPRAPAQPSALQGFGGQGGSAAGVGGGAGGAAQLGAPQLGAPPPGAPPRRGPGALPTRRLTVWQLHVVLRVVAQGPVLPDGVLKGKVPGVRLGKAAVSGPAAAQGGPAAREGEAAQPRRPPERARRNNARHACMRGPRPTLTGPAGPLAAPWRTCNPRTSS